jgi:hypothetical protein
MSIPIATDPDHVLYEVLLARLASPTYLAMGSSVIFALVALFLSAPPESEPYMNAGYAAFSIIPGFALAAVLIHIKKLMPYRNTTPFCNVIQNLTMRNREKRLLSAVYNVYLQSPVDEKEWMAKVLVGTLLDQII